MPPVCKIEGCEKRAITRGWCKAHYARWWKYGDPTTTLRLPAERRFWAKVKKGKRDACWIWLGTSGTGGYGRFRFNGVLVSAHRFSYELMVGEILPGLEIDHLCRNHKCVNPKHLEAVTPEENRNRRILPNTLKTHCSNNHPFNEENTYSYVRKSNGRLKRECRVCHRNKERTRKRNQRGGD